MKKILSIFAMVTTILSGCSDNTSDNELHIDQAYIFYSTTCPHCHHALEYINKNYPNAKIKRMNIAEKQGHELFLKCAQRSKVGDRVGVPLFCIGPNFLMGWAPEYEKKFDRYIRPFNK